MPLFPRLLTGGEHGYQKMKVKLLSDPDQIFLSISMLKIKITGQKIGLAYDLMAEKKNYFLSLSLSLCLFQLNHFLLK